MCCVKRSVFRYLRRPFFCFRVFAIAAHERSFFFIACCFPQFGEAIVHEKMSSVHVLHMEVEPYLAMQQTAEGGSTDNIREDRTAVSRSTHSAEFEN